jgi:CRP-like cAMP-binding protein
MLKGWAARYKTLRDGSRQIVDFVLPGDFCDLHVTLLEAMDHGIVALTPCKVARISAHDVAELTSENNRIVRAMWWSTLVDQGILREWVLNVGRRDAYERVSHLLCELHFRMKRVGLVEGDRLALPLTQDELADAAGLTSVHMNRTLQRLRSEKLIEIGRGMLTLLDAWALQEAAGFNPAYLHVRRRVS